MIKIMRYGEVPNSEIFARPDESIDVSGTVSDILQDVKKKGRRCSSGLLPKV